MNNYIGIGIIIVLGFLAWSFAQLVAGKKKGDAQIIDKVLKENSALMHELEEWKLRAQAIMELYNRDVPTN